jgi:hypothetical protein
MNRTIKSGSIKAFPSQTSAFDNRSVVWEESVQGVTDSERHIRFSIVAIELSLW